MWGLSPPPDIMTFPNFLTLLTYIIPPHILINPYTHTQIMNPHIQNIPTIIERVNEEYIIIYKINDYVGGCTYKQTYTKSKLQPHPIYILTEVSMIDIISYINEISPLSDGDLPGLQMDIRNHSLGILKDYLSSGSTSHI
jgi:hypothetical protein